MATKSCQSVPGDFCACEPSQDSCAAPVALSNQGETARDPVWWRWVAWTCNGGQVVLEGNHTARGWGNGGLK